MGARGRRGDPRLEVDSGTRGSLRRRGRSELLRRLQASRRAHQERPRQLSGQGLAARHHTAGRPGFLRLLRSSGPRRPTGAWRRWRGSSSGSAATASSRATSSRRSPRRRAKKRPTLGTMRRSGTRPWRSSVSSSTGPSIRLGVRSTRQARTGSHAPTRCSSWTGTRASAFPRQRARNLPASPKRAQRSTAFPTGRQAATTPTSPRSRATATSARATAGSSSTPSSAPS